MASVPYKSRLALLRRFLRRHAIRVLLSVGVMLFLTAGPHRRSPPERLYEPFIRSRHTHGFPTLKFSSTDNLDPSVRKAWRKAIHNFMATTNIDALSPRAQRVDYARNPHVHDRTLLLRVVDGHLQMPQLYALSVNHRGRARATIPAVVQALTNLRKRDVRLNALLLMDCSEGGPHNVTTIAVSRHFRRYVHVIPAPFGRYFEEGEEEPGMPLSGWNRNIKETVMKYRKNFWWEDKVNKAVFRASFVMRPEALGSCNRGKCQKPKNWRKVNRGTMYEEATRQKQLFDIGFTKYIRCPTMGAPPDVPWPAAPMKFKDLMKYKYIITVGTAFDWIENLRAYFFLNSAIMLHESESRQFFSGLIQPWVHYIPVDLMFHKLISHVAWARLHDDTVRKIVRNQGMFALRYLTEGAMVAYWEELLEIYAKQQGATAEQVKMVGDGDMVDEAAMTMRMP